MKFTILAAIIASAAGTSLIAPVAHMAAPAIATTTVMHAPSVVTQHAKTMFAPVTATSYGSSVNHLMNSHIMAAPAIMHAPAVMAAPAIMHAPAVMAAPAMMAKTFAAPAIMNSHIMAAPAMMAKTFAAPAIMNSHIMAAPAMMAKSII